MVLTTYADDRSVIDALRAGALGYLTKDAGADEIRQALHRVTSGQACLDPAVQMHLIEAITTTTNNATPGLPASPVSALPDGLTPREAEVLGLIGAGLSNAEIAATTRFLTDYQTEHRKRDVERKPDEAQLAAWRSFCQTLFCRNEFLYVD